MLQNIEQVTAGDVQRVTRELFQDSGLVATVVGPDTATPFDAGRLRI
jgi:hypothetical protein